MTATVQPLSRPPAARRLLPMAALAAVVVGFSGGWRGGETMSDGAGMRSILGLALGHFRDGGGLPYWLDDIWGGTPAWALGPSFTLAWMFPLAQVVGLEGAVKYGGLAAQVAGAWGAFVFARSLWGGTAAPLLAGLVYGLSPMAIGHAALYGIEPVIWVIAAVPWFAWTFRHALVGDGLRWPVAAGAVAAFALLQQAEYAYPYALLGLAFVVVEVNRRRARGGRGLWPMVGRVAVATAVAGGLAAHWLLPLGALQDAFVLAPDDTVEYELTQPDTLTRLVGTTPQVFVRPELATVGKPDVNHLVRGAFYLGAAAVAAALAGVALLRRSDEGWLTATLVASTFSVWLSTAAVPLARSTLSADGLLAFLAIGLFTGALAGAVLRHVRRGRRRRIAFLATVVVLPAIPFVAPFLALRSVVPLLDSVRFPRFYPMAIIGVSLAAAFPVAVLGPRVGAGLPRGRTWFSAALALAVAGLVMVDLHPYRHYYELRAGPRRQRDLAALAAWAREQPDGAVIGTQMFDRPDVVEALTASGRPLSVGWPHPLAGRGYWRLTGEAGNAERSYARRAMGVAATTALVSDPKLHREPGETRAGRFRITANPHALPRARVYDRALVVPDATLAGRLAVSLAHKGVAVVTGTDLPPVPGVEVAHLPARPCPAVEAAAAGVTLTGVDVGAEVGRACALGRWIGLRPGATRGAEQSRTTGVIVRAHQDGLSGIALNLDRPPGPSIVSVHRLVDGVPGPELGRAKTSGSDDDGLWTFDIPPIAASAGGDYLFTLSCPMCGRRGGARLRTVPSFRGRPDVIVGDELIPDRLGAYYPRYGPLAPAPGPTPAAAVDHRGPGRWGVEAGAGGLLVLATAHFPGWQATVGGRPAPVVQADGGLVGVPVPAGGGPVELAWRRPPASDTGRAVTAATAALGALALVLRRRRRPVEAGQPGGEVQRADAPPGPVQASVVVPTCNDEANIAALLRRLLAEPEVAEVVVVASGCTDDTVGQVLATAAQSWAAGRLRLIVEDRRSGKANALNLGFAEARHARLVVASGDVLFEPGAVGLLLEALDRPGVGMAGPRPVPVNDPSTLVGHAVVLHWRLHHRMALRSPKLGEMFALRRALAARLPRISMDEAFLQSRAEREGWACAYVPEAVVHNRGPETVADFVLQRRRNHAGHIWLEHGQGYRVPSLSPLAVLADLLAELREDRGQRRPRQLVWTAAMILLDIWARLLAHLDIATGREQHVWTLVETAKNPARGADGDGPGRRPELPAVGLPQAAARQRDHQHQLPVQLQVPDLQRVRAQGDRADHGGVGAGISFDGPGPGVDDLQRR